MAFVLKKLISLFLYPLGLAISGLVLGLVLLRGYRRLGRWLIILSTIALYAFSTPLVGHWLLLPLEREAGNYLTQERMKQQGIAVIVVLSGSMADGDLTLTDAMGTSTTARMLEGLRLWKLAPRSLLIVSGGNPRGDKPAALAMYEFAREYGIKDGRTIYETESRDTGEQAENLVELIGENQPFALVTSAYHMPRSLALFQAKGLKPTAAPCQYFSRFHPFTWWDLMPQASGIKLSQLAIHEYLGIAWASLLGR